LKKGKILKLFAALLLSVISSAASAAPHENMNYIRDWQGSFDATFIQKFEDPQDGVVCYVMAPNTLSTSTVNGTLRFEGNNVGSISCVKVHETQTEKAEKKRLYDDAVSEIAAAVKTANVSKNNKK
jgi:hypothetical protein